MRSVKVNHLQRIDTEMPRNPSHTRLERRLKFEQFEKRLVMSAQAVAGILPEIDAPSTALVQAFGTWDSSSTQHASDVASHYGLDGTGQTVAVIDSGIAWDHHALGAGFGDGAKVVGGWDFAENDADPYDDGPAGYHGSHVAGIIGSTDDSYRGVSSGADLVGLRVFGDHGQGELAWVEQALQWVHEHQNDFANPITTVNLSLGMHWNAESMPDWASLEDEFAQLESDGMFISVAAGNSFLTFGQNGLSYPAVSEHVVPVASHDAEGNISDFSQRDDGVLVAPGESIRSTVPDHLFGGTSGDRFLGATGTSMAAPYVAGASVVLRQANEFMGITDVTQDMLYDQFRDTADKIYDSVTSGYFYRINLDAALASVIQDRHSDTPDNATELGVIKGGETIQGTIGNLSDSDQFEFSAQHSGTVTLSLSVTDSLVPQVNVAGADAIIEGHQITFNVEAGETYNFDVAGANGVGHYQIDTTFEAAPVSGSETGSEHDLEMVNSTNWGHIISKQILNQEIDGESTFELRAVRDGILTIESFFEAGESLKLDVYDSKLNLVHSSVTDQGSNQLDFEAHSGETYFLKASGHIESVDFRVSNLVSVDSQTLTIHGTHSDDVVSVSVDEGFEININGIQYQFESVSLDHIKIVGHQGNDSIELALGSEDDRVNSRTTGFSVSNSTFTINAVGFNSTRISGGEGDDSISMIGSTGDNQLVTGESGSNYKTILSGLGFTREASGFELTQIRATQGFSSAVLSGTQGDDLFVSRGERSSLRSEDYFVLLDGFDRISVDGRGGHDQSNLFGQTAEDVFRLSPETANLESASLELTVEGFSRVNAFSNGGADSILMLDSTEDDTFFFRNGNARLSGNHYSLLASGFSNVETISTHGNDLARVFDSIGNDVYFSDANNTKLVTDEATVVTRQFQRVNLIAKQGGHDQAWVTGTDGRDELLVNPNRSLLKMSNGRITNIIGVEQVDVDTLGGIDSSLIHGSEQRDRLEASYSQIELESTIRLLRMANLEHTHFNGHGGGDEVMIEDLGNLDLLRSFGEEAIAYVQDHTVRAKGFSTIEASTVDDAIAKYDFDVVDFLYSLQGNWTEK